MSLPSPTPSWPGLSTEDAPFGGDQARFDDGEWFYTPEECRCWSPATDGHYRRSFSMSDAEAAAGWKPCLYFARGFCKNGSSCCFLHGLPENVTEAVVRSELMASAFPFSSSPRDLNFLLQQHQQQSDSHRKPPICTRAISLDPTPTGLLDFRYPFDLHSPQIGQRMMYGSITSQEAFLRRKLEEEQQQGAELHSRRFMELQLLDLKSGRGHQHHHLSSPVALAQADGNGSTNGNNVHLEDVTMEDHKVRTSAPADISSKSSEDEHEEEDGNGALYNNASLFNKIAP